MPSASDGLAPMRNCAGSEAEAFQGRLANKMLKSHVYLIKMGYGRKEVHEPSAWYEKPGCSVQQVPQALAQGVGGGGRYVIDRVQVVGARLCLQLGSASSDTVWRIAHNCSKDILHQTHGILDSSANKYTWGGQTPSRVHVENPEFEIVNIFCLHLEATPTAADS